VVPPRKKSPSFDVGPEVALCRGAKVLYLGMKAAYMLLYCIRDCNCRAYLDMDRALLFYRRAGLRGLPILGMFTEAPRSLLNRTRDAMTLYKFGME